LNSFISVSLRHESLGEIIPFDFELTRKFKLTKIDKVSWAFGVQQISKNSVKNHIFMVRFIDENCEKSAIEFHEMIENFLKLI
jgi:hypothetical protein